MRTFNIFLWSGRMFLTASGPYRIPRDIHPQIQWTGDFWDLQAKFCHSFAQIVCAWSVVLPAAKDLHSSIRLYFWPTQISREASVTFILNTMDGSVRRSSDQPQSSSCTVPLMSFLRKIMSWESAIIQGSITVCFRQSQDSVVLLDRCPWFSFTDLVAVLIAWWNESVMYPTSIL